MKSMVNTFTILLAGINAVPQDEIPLSGEQQRLLTSNIQRVVEEINQRIRDAGLDPVYIDHRSTQLITPIGGIGLWVDDLWCSGISQNRFDRMDFSIFTSRLRVDFVWDSIVCVTRRSGVKLSFLGHELSATQSGGLEVSQLRLRGDLRFSVRPVVGVSLRDCELELSADIKSDLKIKIQNLDLSDQVNNSVAKLNELLRANKDAIGKKLCELAGSLL